MPQAAYYPPSYFPSLADEKGKLYLRRCQWRRTFWCRFCRIGLLFYGNNPLSKIYWFLVSTLCIKSACSAYTYVCAQVFSALLNLLFTLYFILPQVSGLLCTKETDIYFILYTQATDYVTPQPLIPFCSAVKVWLAITKIFEFRQL